MVTPGSVIDSLGGTQAVASALSLATPTVSLWRRRGIPSRRWPALVRLAERRGVKTVTFEALVETASTGPEVRA